VAELPTPVSIERTKTKSSRFKMDRVLMIVSAHFINDTYSALIAPFLPNLIKNLSSTYTKAGSLSAITRLPSLFNPTISYLDDKINLRILIILAPAIIGTTMSCLGVTPNYISLTILLFITGLSVATFHAPSPAKIARVSANQIGKGMSLCMAGGVPGRTVSHLIASWGLLTFKLDGRMTILVLVLPGYFSLSSQPIMLAIVQDQLLNNQSVGNGVFIAMNFLCLSLAAIGFGMIGDKIGLSQVFICTAITGLLVAPLIWALPKQPTSPQLSTAFSMGT
jgi:predicted MFS family arabinose efflux permease